MTKRKLLIVSDLHYCPDLAAEVAAMQPQLPADEYDHMRDGRLFWHNEMLVEAMGAMLTKIVALAEREKPDLVLFLGDLVSTNWPENIAPFAAQLAAFSCPVTMVTGNHDLYLSAPAARVQDVVAPGDFASGMRHRMVGDMGLILLDLFVAYADGSYQKSLDGEAEVIGMGYRPTDVTAACELLAEHPQTPFLLFGHFPMASSLPQLAQPGRKIGDVSPSGQALMDLLLQPNNLQGIFCGHQHFNHLQQWPHGFHWSLPALVEYPCAVALLEIDERVITGQLIQPDPTLSARSLQSLNQQWCGGTPAEQQLHHVIAL